MVFKPQIRPIRIVLRWQIIVTAVLALVALLLWGRDGALSAALGGAINVIAGWVYGWRVSQGEARTAGEALRTMFRAEGIKVLLIVVQLWAVLASYRDIVHAAFFAAFVVTVGVFAAAIAVREPEEQKSTT
ncbi:MAG: ATP synthase subunit I [Pseudomonadota bacterium]|nr:ATP synthase subunit I [Pseudomonadota bacterium]